MILDARELADQLLAHDSVDVALKPYDELRQVGHTEPETIAAGHRQTAGFDHASVSRAAQRAVVR